MRHQHARLSLALAASTVLIAACNSDGRTLRPAKPDQTQSIYTASTTSTIVDGVESVDQLPSAILPFAVDLPWADGGPIDPKYTCNGDDVHPAITWIGAPDTAVQLALVVTDTDASDFVHWVIAGLDPHDPLIPEGSLPLGAIEGLNGFSTDAAPVTGWRGPCPPAGAVHHYKFALYALDQQMELPPGSPAEDMLAVINASALQVATATGTYQTP